MEARERADTAAMAGIAASSIQPTSSGVYRHGHTIDLLLLMILVNLLLPQRALPNVSAPPRPRIIAQLPQRVRIAVEDVRPELPTKLSLGWISLAAPLSLAAAQLYENRGSTTTTRAVRAPGMFLIVTVMRRRRRKR